MIDTVIFDMDGVLIDSEIVYINILHEKLIKKKPDITKESLYSIVGSSSKNTKKIIFDLMGEPLDSPEFNEEYNSYFADVSVDYPSILREDAHAVLGEIKAAGYKLALASSTSTAGINRVMTSCDLAKYFEQIISGDMFKETKPHPEIYLHTAKLLGSEPSNCLVIEDSTYGITAGHNAGMTVAAVIDERFSFDRTLADYQINSLSDIISLLDKLKFCTA